MQLVRAPFIICVVSALLFATPTSAQKYLFNRLDLATGTSPQGVAVADFNKDGMSDFAVANSGDGTVSVFLGKSDGTFQTPSTLLTGSASAPTAIVAVDLNLDSKVDLAVTLNGANNVMVFPGTGTGTFNSPLTFAVGTGPTAMVAADFNKDKKLDLAVVNNTASSVSILMNNSTISSISFTAASNISAGLGLAPTSIVAADFNADTKLDLAVGSATGKEVSVMLGTGTGTFGTPVNAVFGQNVYSVAAADFDKDGKMDLIAGGNFSIGVKLGNGDGTFGTATYWPFSSAGAIGLYPLDVNGDKKMDVIAVNYGTSDTQTAITVQINTTTAIGNPTFAFPPRRYGVGYQPRGIAVGDFNFDAKTDVLVAAKGSNYASVLLGDGKGHFDPGLATPIGKAQCQFLAAADFNKDNKTDIAISCMGGNVQVFLGKGTGLFNAPITLTAGAGPQDMAATDFNGDGYIDLAVTNRNSNNISLFLNNKAGGFTGPVNYATGNSPVGVVAGNFTLAGHVDLAVVNSIDSTLQVFPGTTSGTFGAPATYALAASPQGIVAGDFNNDGKLDLAVAAVSAVSVLLNNTGTFPTHKDYTLSGQPTRIATASLRNNGVLDLVVTLPLPKSVAVFLGKNDGTFATPPVTYPTKWGGVGLSIADFNADGFLDVVVATGDPIVTVHLGNGDGTLQPLLSYHVGGGPNDSDAYDIAAVDVNNDGFPDFVTADYGDAMYAVYLNTPVAALRPAKMNFGTLLLGSTSAAQTATMYNSGIATLKPKITQTGTDYTQTSNTCGTSLISGASCSVSVVFSPKDINTRAGALTFADNATVTPQKVTFSGVGSEVGVNPSPVAFGPIVHGTNTTKVVTITNLSGGAFPGHALTFTGIAVSGTGFSLATNACPPSTSSLAAGDSCQVTVRFAPSTTGSFSGLLTLTDNGGGSPQKIKLTGSGT